MEKSRLPDILRVPSSATLPPLWRRTAKAGWVVQAKHSYSHPDKTVVEPSLLTKSKNSAWSLGITEWQVIVLVLNPVKQQVLGFPVVWDDGDRENGTAVFNKKPVHPAVH